MQFKNLNRPFNPAAPLAGKLKFLWGLTAPDGRRLKCITNSNFNADFAAGNSWRLSDAGYGVAFNDSPFNLGAGAEPTTSSLFTLFVRFKFSDSSPNSQTIYSRITSGECIGLVIQSSGEVILSYVGHTNYVSTGKITWGETTDVAVTFDGTNAVFYINGIYDSTVAAPDINLVGTNILYGMGKLYAGHPIINNGVIHHFGIFDAVITPQAAWQLRVNPEQLLKNNRNKKIPLLSVINQPIDLSGSTTDQVSADADLSTSIEFSGNAQGQVAATGDIATAIELSGHAENAASTQADLTASIAADAMASIVVVTHASLSTEIHIDGSAGDVATVVGVLSTLPGGWSSSDLSEVTATGQLSTTIQAAGDTADATNATGSLSTNIKASGQAADEVTATATLESSTQLSGAAANLVTAHGDIRLGIKISGAAVMQSLTMAGLSSDIVLQAAAINAVTTHAGMSSNVRMQGSAANAASADADLSASGAQMVGHAIDTVFAAGTFDAAGANFAAAAGNTVATIAAMTAAIKLSGVSLNQALTAAGLYFTEGLHGAAELTAHAQGGVDSGVLLVGNGMAVVSGAGVMATMIPIQGLAASISNSTGELTLHWDVLNLVGAVAAESMANATITAHIDLNAAAIMQVLSQAELKKSAGRLVATIEIYPALTAKVGINRAI